MTTNNQHKTKRLDDGSYEYRDRLITRYDGTPKGYWGRWYTCHKRFTTFKECKDHIDWLESRRHES